MGVWSRNAFLVYTSTQVGDLRKLISDLVETTNTFYTTPEVEIIYYTSGKPRTQSHRLHPNQGNNRNTNYPLFLPLRNPPQGRNNHDIFSENMIRDVAI